MSLTLYIECSDHMRHWLKVKNENKYTTDSGYDLSFEHGSSIEPNETKLVGTGVKIASVIEGGLLPTVVPTLLFPRSSISKTPLILHNSIGLIDADYRGEVKAALRNLSDETYHLSMYNSTLVQLVPFWHIGQFTEVRFVDDINTIYAQTKRGDNGFGSTN